MDARLQDAEAIGILQTKHSDGIAGSDVVRDKSEHGKSAHAGTSNVLRLGDESVEQGVRR